VLEEYKHLKNLILTNKELKPEQSKEKLEKLKSGYLQLLEKTREEANQPSNRINSLHKQTILLYNLMKLWESYILYVKMEDHAVRMLQSMEPQKPGEGPQDLDTELKKLAKKGEENKLDFEDAQTSANEKHTTATESEEDIEKQDLRFEQEKLDPKIISSQIEEPEKKESAVADEVEQKFLDIGYEELKRFEKEFEDQYEKSGNKERFLYGLVSDAQAVEGAEFLKNQTIGDIFPEDLINNIQDFSEAKLIFKDLKEIEKHEVDDDEHPKKLRSSVVSEVYKEKLGELLKSENLSRKEKTKVTEVRKLMNKIAEIRVQEPKMLLRIIEIYNPVIEFE